MEENKVIGNGHANQLHVIGTGIVPRVRVLIIHGIEVCQNEYTRKYAISIKVIQSK